MVARNQTFLIVGLISLIISCSVPLKPTTFEAESLPYSLSSAYPLAVKAKLTGKQSYELEMAGPNISVNDDEFTNTVVDQLTRTLQKNGVFVDPNSNRIIEIQVVHIAVQPSGNMFCVIDFNRTLDDGRIRGLQARAGSWNYEKACKQALTNTVAELLKDSETVEYIAGK